MYSHLTMDKYGNIYLGLDTLKSIDYDGNLRWEFGIDDKKWISSPIVIDQNDIIYFTAGVGPSHEIYAIKSNGEILWKTDFPERLNYEDYYGFAVGYQKLILPGYKNQILASIK